MGDLVGTGGGEFRVFGPSVLTLNFRRPRIVSSEKELTLFCAGNGFVLRWYNTDPPDSNSVQPQRGFLRGRSSLLASKMLTPTSNF